MDDNQLFDLAGNHVARENYHAAVNVLNQISDLNFKVNKTHFLLGITAINHVSKKYGRVIITQDRDEYEKIKSGQGKYHKHTAIYRDTSENIEGLEEMIELIPEENPIKVFYRSIKPNS